MALHQCGSTEKMPAPKSHCQAPTWVSVASLEANASAPVALPGDTSRDEAFMEVTDLRIL
jgi:hypothetical protein